ncbi:hypothetical protein FPOAC1_004894 [Fusarium poae]|uniref:hypothetical protein n=1 Tax=Fusarium poae TaxID=36050 RepID=UPI001CE7FCC4|nr:hypothetical protein FPOAC1_004894 [Fusarium poae]KAG8671642.1 hypothetical protein FPOAC1_004894 [Fusarium poae]
MPPALSDDENSDFEEFTTPPRTARKKSTSAVVADKFGDTKDGSEEELDEDDDEDEDLDEDEFVVEAIKKHLIDEDGSLKFQVNESAQEILDQYLDKLGGREKLFEETETASKTKKRRRATNGGTPSTTASTTKRSRRGDAHPANTTPPATSKPWSPPAGSWEDEIESIELEEDENIGKIIVYLRWKNGKKTKHDTDVMLRFYERHLKIDRGENKELVEGAEN